LGDVRVGSLLFNGSEELKGLQLAAHWTAAGMQIDSVRWSGTPWYWTWPGCYNPLATGH
jgi:hypothetical protein